MELNEWSGRIEGISAAYGEYFAVERTPEWVLLELTEEVGELTQAYLASSGQGRNRGKSDDELRQDLEGEVADAFATILVFARSAGIDIESALTTKWLPWEKFHADRAAGLAPEPLAHRWPEPSDDDPQASS
ncbi:MazG nucleotide pyrophosphohydrolase domain-containing protein [Dermacoccus nishinomiyaensis]|uniref:MazG nucleotide pyrophosphohydrolase domain-containing protein n=1 Tax=Dermacoccus nishinomiyaensis TaxID=1274 RepID=UPI00119E5E65|nr:MazG nucleotide pyrophosphohydrolase domain-containing protein [Dermacoccus nishinomiyaensis]